MATTQAQMFASWRNLLGGAKVLIELGRENEIAAALQNIDKVQTELLLAQVFGVPDDDESEPA